jgi:hypothetical protein
MSGQQGDEPLAEAAPVKGTPMCHGEGHISGTLSIFLGSLSRIAVLCFHFPEYLATPELQLHPSIAREEFDSVSQNSRQGSS